MTKGCVHSPLLAIKCYRDIPLSGGAKRFAYPAFAGVATDAGRRFIGVVFRGA